MRNRVLLSGIVIILIAMWVLGRLMLHAILSNLIHIFINQYQFYRILPPSNGNNLKKTI